MQWVLRSILGTDNRGVGYQRRSEYELDGFNHSYDDPSRWGPLMEMRGLENHNNLVPQPPPVGTHRYYDIDSFGGQPGHQPLKVADTQRLLDCSPMPKPGILKPQSEGTKVDYEKVIRQIEGMTGETVSSDWLGKPDLIHKLIHLGRNMERQERNIAFGMEPLGSSTPAVDGFSAGVPYRSGFASSKDDRPQLYYDFRPPDLNYSTQLRTPLREENRYDERDPVDFSLDDRPQLHYDFRSPDLNCSTQLRTPLRKENRYCERDPVDSPFQLGG